MKKSEKFLKYTDQSKTMNGTEISKAIAKYNCPVIPYSAERQAIKMALKFIRDNKNKNSLYIRTPYPLS